MICHAAPADDIRSLHADLADISARVEEFESRQKHNGASWIRSQPHIHDRQRRHFMNIDRVQPVLTCIASVMVIVGGILGIGWVLVWAIDAKLAPIHTSLTALDHRLTAMERSHDVPPAQPKRPLKH